MALEDIDSPPYPAEGCTAAGLFVTLGRLAEWVSANRDGINDVVGQEVVPDVRELPDKKAYLAQPVQTQYQHLLLLRRIREEWDHLVRTFEEDWDCKACVRSRAVLMQSAAVLLNGAFTPYEVREARAHKDRERMQRSFERLVAHLRKVMEPHGGQEEKEEGD